MTFKVKASSDGLSAQLGINGQYPITVDANGISSGVKLSPDSLTQFYNCTLDGAHRDMYRSGWLPAWFNQQWGGAQWGGLPDGSFGDVATGYIENDNQDGFGNTGGMMLSQQFILSETLTPSSVYLKLFKIGNPTDNLQLQLFTDSAGSPGTVIGSMTTLSGKLLTSKSDGEWYNLPVSFGAITAGTKYHLLLSRSGAADASNRYAIKSSYNTKYPNNVNGVGDTTSTVTKYPTHTWNFLIPNPAANALIQSGGMFDHKLSFNTGNPINQSRAVQQPLSNFYDGKNCSVMHRGTYVPNSNVWDFLYGLDHDRITVTINASGFPVLSIYESDKTLHQVTSTTSVTTGAHDIGIKVRTRGDGQDYAYLYVDGVSQGAPIVNATITMDKNLRELGTARLGDGFGLTPAWTVETDMSVLPSAAGWTWTTGSGATETSWMSIFNNKLYQINAVSSSVDTGYYSRTLSGGTLLNNATGWTTEYKIRVASSQNSPLAFANSVTFQIHDGAKFIMINLTEYFMQVTDNSNIIFTYQSDFKNSERAITICGKGSDFYIFLDGRLIIDGTGKLSSVSVSNQIVFGDGSSLGGNNADAIWDYVKIYNGGMLLPTSGAIGTGNSCSEFAHWSGDKSSLYPMLWNAGTPLSIKSLCGVEKNYVGEGIVQKEVRRWIGGGTSTSSAEPTQVVIPNMECFTIGSDLESSFSNDVFCSSNIGVSAIYMSGKVDGKVIITNNMHSHGASILFKAYIPVENKQNVGLHKLEYTNAISSGHIAYQDPRGLLNLESKS